MRIPNKVRISGVDYTVKYITFENECQTGRINYATSEIWLTKKAGGDNVSRDQLELSFLHELIHGILDAYIPKHSCDEDLVNGLSQGLFSVMKNHKGIFAI